MNALVAEAVEPWPGTLRHAVVLGSAEHEGFLDREAFAAAAEGVPVDEVHRLRRAVCLRDEAMMMYTSGTTADPKGCVLTHEALVRTGMAAAERWQTVHEDRFWNALPMFHMSQVFPQLAHMHSGATIVTHTRFEPDVALETLERERISYAFTTFPVITQAIINHPRFEETDLSSVRLVNETGAAETIRGVQRKFAPAPVVTLFGMTETSGGITWGAPTDDEEARITTGGLPLRGTEVRVVDPETDEDLPTGTPGEILVRGPGLFERYHNDPEKTAAIGYCFGGAIVLSMARMGVNLDAVASFHGALGSLPPVAPGGVKARVLVLNGEDDPMITPQQIEAFEKEMDAAKASYEFVNLPHARHSFTNPDAAKAGMDALAYNPEADKDSWARMLKMFGEVFGKK